MRSKIVVCILIFISIADCRSDRSQERRRALQNLNFNEPILERWVRGAFSVPDNLFVPVDTAPDLLFRPLEESKATIAFFLKEEVDPYRGVKDVRWTAHAAQQGGMDLLKSNYRAAGLRLAITEGCNVLFINISKVNESLGQSRSKRDYVDDLIKVAMKTETRDHHWEFQLPPDLDQSWNQRLISNRGASPIRDLQSRHDRADILLWNDSVYFIFYKKIDQLEDFLPDDQWFSPQARAALKAAQKN